MVIIINLCIYLPPPPTGTPPSRRRRIKILPIRSCSHKTGPFVHKCATLLARLCNALAQLCQRLGRVVPIRWHKVSKITSKNKQGY
ncbi:hypothetical protein DWZ35_06220 [Bacteroides caccae]|nr:hypothetical protein DWZ35_06220 [Bacteroides caccae]